MLTKSEENLIEVLAKYNLGIELAETLPSGLEDEQMDILSEYICEKMETQGKIATGDIIRAKLILMGKIVIEDDE